MSAICLAAYAAGEVYGRSADVSAGVLVPSVGGCRGCRRNDGGNTVIEVENLSKRYGEMLAVDGLDFRRSARHRDRLSRPERGR